jgi:hypothetical protein
MVQSVASGQTGSLAAKNGDSSAVLVKQPRTKYPSIYSKVLCMARVEAERGSKMLGVANQGV